MLILQNQSGMGTPLDHFGGRSSNLHSISVTPNKGFDWRKPLGFDCVATFHQSKIFVTVHWEVNSSKVGISTTKGHSPDPSSLPKMKEERSRQFRNQKQNSHDSTLVYCSNRDLLTDHWLKDLSFLHETQLTLGYYYVLTASDKNDITWLAPQYAHSGLDHAIVRNILNLPVIIKEFIRHNLFWLTALLLTKDK